MVHKFITKGTIEEKIDTIIEEKQKLSKDLLASGGEQWITEYNNEELMKIFALNLESYADYINRIARGKSYVRSNMVLDNIIVTED